MFILPLLAILLGIESFMVFSRVTASYGESLKEAYTILVVTKKSMKPEEFKALDSHIVRIKPVEKDAIVEQISQGMSNASTQEIIKALPHFYTLYLDRYLNAANIETIKKRLVASPNVRRVETFGQAHNANYNLYMLIRASLWTFVGFMVFTSLFLVVKQMEIWQLEHRERMQVMEILGASGMLRSGVLFRIALTDAVIAALVTIGVFAFLRYAWVARSEIDLLVQKQTLVFEFKDIAILGGIAFVIVMVSVVLVANSVKETRVA
jgi:cell division transport system permease protein